MNTADVMTRRVVTVTPDTLVGDAARLMIDHRISGLPVVDGDHRLVGVITEGDLLRRAELGTERARGRWSAFFAGPGRLASEFVESHGRKVGEVMSQTVISASETTSLADLVAQMERHRVKRLPVVRDGKLIGIVSRSNLLHALAAALISPPAVHPDDSALAERARAAIDEQPWGRSSSVRVIAREGVVTLCGTIVDERARLALKVLVENLPGVRSVVDDLVWIDPNSGYILQPSSSVDAA